MGHEGAPPFMTGTITDFLVVADQIFILVLLIAAGYVAEIGRASCRERV